MDILPRKPRLLWVILCALVGVFLLVVWSGLRKEVAVTAWCEALRADYREHHRMDSAELPRAMDRLNRIRTELASAQVPEWAGEYSWSCTYQWRGCFTVDPVTFTEGFALAPKAGAVWWFGEGDPSQARCVDHGEIAQATGGELVIDWTLNPLDPHDNGFPQQRLLDRVLVRVGSALVPAVRMPVYCASHVEVPSMLAALAPRKGGWDATEFAQKAEERSAPVVVEVPDAWREYVLAEPLFAPCTIESADYSPARWSWTRLLPPRAPTDETPEEDWQPRLTFVVCTVPLGTQDGLRQGMPMFFADRYAHAGTVVRVNAHESRVEFVTSTPRDPEDAFRSGEVLSTEPRRW